MFIGLRAKRVFRDEEGGGDQSGGGGPTIEELTTQLAESKSQNTSMKSKMDELLTETKLAKTKRRDAVTAADEAAKAKALKDGDFEQLLASSQKANDGLQGELNSLRSGIASEKQKGAAMLLASELADGTNAELLSTFISPRLKSTEDGLKILDSNGQLTVSTIEDLKTEFQNNSRYLSLLKGNQSSGGGATGGNKGGSAADKVITRGEFEAMNPKKKMEFVKSGGTTTD